MSYGKNISSKELNFFSNNFIVIYKKKTGLLICVLYSDTYYWFYPLPSNIYKKFVLDKCFYGITEVSLLNPIALNYYTTFKAYLKSFYIFTYFKLNFKGKGFYIFKNYRNTIAPRFGKSHRMYLYLYYSYIIFLSKVKIFIFGINKIDTMVNSKQLFFIRPINIFTMRGIRFSKQLIYKKKLVIS